MKYCKCKAAAGVGKESDAGCASCDVGNEQGPVRTGDIHWHYQPLAAAERYRAVTSTVHVNAGILPAHIQKRRQHEHPVSRTPCQEAQVAVHYIVIQPL